MISRSRNVFEHLSCISMTHSMSRWAPAFWCHHTACSEWSETRTELEKICSDCLANGGIDRNLQITNFVVRQCMERHQKQQSAGLQRTRCVDVLICLVFFMRRNAWSNTPWWQDWNAPSNGFKGSSGSQMLGEPPRGNQHHPIHRFVGIGFFFGKYMNQIWKIYWI